MSKLSKYIKKQQSEAFWRFIQSNPDKPWKWNCISLNPNITYEIIQANPDKPWNWYYISANPNIIWEIIQANPDKHWDWNYISYNKFTLQNKLIAEQCRKEWVASNKIKKNWVNVFWNINYQIGRKRLFRSLETDEYSVW